MLTINNFHSICSEVIGSTVNWMVTMVSDNDDDYLELTLEKQWNSGTVMHLNISRKGEYVITNNWSKRSEVILKEHLVSKDRFLQYLKYYLAQYS